jgi:acylphosphatase
VVVVHRLHALIRGRVQGVGFRFFVLRRARALGLSGWVRNRPDGAVEVEAQGPRAALESLAASLREGPPAAGVSRLEETWGEGPATYRGFDVTG